MVAWTLCSVNIPSEHMFSQTNAVGTTTGHDVNKSGIVTMFYGRRDKAPLAEGFPAAIACELREIIQWNRKGPSLYGLKWQREAHLAARPR